VSGKLLSLFDHPTFVRRSQERAQRELAVLVLPAAERLSPSRLRCSRCAHEYEVIPRLPTAHRAPPPEPCPKCQDCPEQDALEAFLAELIHDD
jgi:hypothetical protein